MGNDVQSVDRAVRVLLSFEHEGQGRTLTELAELLGVHKSTASRLAATLRRRGLLEWTPDGEAFRLGSELGRIGILALGGRDLISLARGPMTSLGAASGETVTLAVLHGVELTTVAQIDSEHVVRPASWIGRRTPIHATSDGKVWLAFGKATLPPGPLRQLTDSTHTQRRALERELEQVRRQGWAQAVAEFEDGLHGVAAPVIDVLGRCRAALCVSGPSYRLTVEDLPRLGEACRTTAAEVGALIVAGGDGGRASAAAAPPSSARGALMGGGRPAR